MNDPTVSRPAAAIELRELRVDYGSFVAVRDLSLKVGAGEICGLVGPNGAGKTSTFRVLATLMQPTYGEVRLCGVDLLEDPRGARRLLGYMPDLAPAPSDLRVWEFLDHFAEAHRLGCRRRRREIIDQALEEVALTAKRAAFCRTLSRGQTQRLVLAKTRLHQPRVMILDEPASGMDPLSRWNLRMALRRLAGEGVTIFISSHILSELAEMCTSLCVMHQGVLLASGTVEEVRRALGQAGRRLHLTLTRGAEEAARWLEGRPGVSDVREEAGRIHLQLEGGLEEQADLLHAMVLQGLRVAGLEVQGSSFEELLIRVAEGGRPPHSGGSAA